MWSIWDKTSDINGCSAEEFLGRHKFLKDEKIIYLKTVNGRIVEVAGKGVLATVYGIDPSLPDDEFIAEYERVLTEPADSAIYDELAQIYAEGVNSIDE